MIMRQLTRFAILSFFVTILAMPAIPALGKVDPQSTEFNFNVYLDKKKIGYHNFRITELAGRHRIDSEANFLVKFLFITAYRYEHRNTEYWAEGCLQEINSSTDANGNPYSVVGSQGPLEFELDASGSVDHVPGCVKTFAYWNPTILNESALLNSQTGELVEVAIAPPEKESFSVFGKSVEARRHRITGDGLAIDIWYSKDSRWLGLESTTNDGKKLRYELT